MDFIMSVRVYRVSMCKREAVDGVRRQGRGQRLSLRRRSKASCVLAQCMPFLRRASLS